MVCLKSLLSRFSVLISYTMQSSNHFSTSSCFPRFLWSRFSGSRFFRVQYFRLQVFQGPGFQSPSFSGSSFFRFRVQGPGPGFRSSPFKGAFHFCVIKSSRSQIFFKIGFLKSFAIFKGKYLCWSLYFNKFAGLQVFF